MTKPVGIPVAEYPRLQFIRWVLLLIAANEAAGLPAVTRHRLHSLLFMSFASSRYYGICPLQHRARRTEQGPYYRLAHVALGHLTLGGLVELTQYKAYPASRDLQFDGNFRLTADGLVVAHKFRLTWSGKAIYQLLLDICLAAARTMHSDQLVDISDRLDSLFNQDLTYQRALKQHGELLELEISGEGSPTPTVNGLREINSYLQRQVGEPLNRKDILAAYQSLLDRRAVAA